MAKMKKRWNAELVKNSKLPFYVKSLWEKTHDEKGDFLPNGVLWYNSAVVYRFHPYLANQPLPTFGKERDMITVQMYRDLEKACQSDTSLYSLLDEKDAFGNKNDIVHSMDTLKKSYLSIPAKTRQSYINEMAGCRYAKDVKPVRDAWTLIQQRNLDWDKEKFASRIISMKGFAFRSARDVRRDLFRREEKDNGLFSGIQRKLNNILGRSPKKERKAEEKKKDDAVRYAVLDKIAENFHNEMTSFSANVAQTMERDAELVRNMPWVVTAEQQKGQEQVFERRHRHPLAPQRSIPSPSEGR